MSVETIGLVFLTALILSLMLVPASSIVARKIGAIDHPKERGAHSKPIPRLGGLGIALSLFISCLFFLPSSFPVVAFLSGLLIITSVGLIDDVFQISPKLKFIGQTLAVLIFIYAGGGSIVTIGNIFGFGEIKSGYWAVPLTIFCVVGAINSFNLSDGLDGLAGGLATIAAISMAMFAWILDAHGILIISIAFSASVIGFLKFNSHPAKLFMGDTGSLAIGYTLSVLIVRASQKEIQFVPLVSFAMLIALPLLDTLLVMARRIRYGHSPFSPDKTHLHHRLMSLGFSHPAVVAIMYFLMASFCIAALMLYSLPEWIQLAFMLMYGGGIFGGVSFMQHKNIDLGKWGNRLIVWEQIGAHYVSDFVAKKATFVNRILLASLLVPAIFFPLLTLSREESLSILFLGGMVIFFGWHHQSNQRGVFHGAIYLAIASLLLVFNLSSDSAEPYFGWYLNLYSGLALLWVVVKLVFCRRNAFLFTSSFEFLMLFIVWFVPFVVLPHFHVSPSIQTATKIACLESLIFLSVAKLHFYSEKNSHRTVLLALVLGLVVVALRTLFSW